MPKKVVILTAILVCLLAVLLLIPREKPESFLFDFWQHQNDNTWGNIKIKDVEYLPEYVAVHITYDQIDSPMLSRPDRWVVKDRTKIDGFKWEGYIYLVKRGLYSWSIVQ